MPFVPGQPAAAAVLAPEALARTNIMELFVFENRVEGYALLVARMDNLGKGASGAAAHRCTSPGRIFKVGLMTPFVV
jgi:N-acetyl-gamma-glutamylphosphate reductase